MKIDKLIDHLMRIKKKHGNLEVKISSDEEGNSRGLLGNRSLQHEIEKGKHVVIFPVDQEDPMDDW